MDYQTGLCEKYLVTGDWSQSRGAIITEHWLLMIPRGGVNTWMDNTNITNQRKAIGTFFNSFLYKRELTHCRLNICPHTILEDSTFNLRHVRQRDLAIPTDKMIELFANSGDTDQRPCSVASDLGLHCLPINYSLMGFVCVEVLWPSQPNGVSQARSVYLTTLLLGRLSPLSC